MDSAWFREDLERLFGLLASRAIRPRVAERISFDEVAEAHRRVEAGGLEGKLVLCPEPPRRDATGWRLGASWAPLPCRPRPRPEASISSFIASPPAHVFKSRISLSPVLG